jgi:hypothetical protein
VAASWKPCSENCGTKTYLPRQSICPGSMPLTQASCWRDILRGECGRSAPTISVPHLIKGCWYGEEREPMERNSITLKELLDLIRRDLSSDPKLSAKNLGRRMLRLSQTADQLAESAGKVPETAGIRLVVDGETEFLKHLHEKRWGTTASSLHVGRRNMLLRYA